MKNFLYFILIIFLLGCISNTQPLSRIPFPIDEYQSLNKKGTGVIKGQAFLKTRGGTVKTAAGNKVLLNPVTSYSRQWYIEGFLQDHPLENPDPRYNQYIYETTADADGRFEFINIPQGEYYLVTHVFWEVASISTSSLLTQGGYIVQKIIVKNDQTYKVILTK